jgi:hypothetical protein
MSKKKRLMRLARKAYRIEGPLRNVRCVTLLMRLYQDNRNEAPEPWDERNADAMQFNYLADRLVEEVAAPEVAFYGEAALAQREAA